MQMTGHGLRLTCMALNSSMVQTQTQLPQTWDLALMLMITMMMELLNPLRPWVVLAMMTPCSLMQV